MKRRTLLTGISGQDGSYLAEFLLEKDYEVYGLIRRTSHNPYERIHHLLDSLRLIPGDLTDQPSLNRAIQLAKPHEVYHLASQSDVAESYVEPIHTTDVTGLGAVRVFEAVRTQTGLSEHVRVYQASSSEQFGNQPTPQSESTPFAPESPYACAKTYAHQMAQVYRNSYQLYIACGIAFNHESPRRGEQFVTRRITQGLARIKLGLQQTFPLFLPSPIPYRDWCHAKDVVRAMWLMLQQPRPTEYILASGTTASVLEFGERAARELGLTFQECISHTPSLRRPSEAYCFQGDARKAAQELGWSPQISFPELITEMVHADLDRETQALHHSPDPQRGR